MLSKPVAPAAPTPELSPFGCSDITQDQRPTAVCEFGSAPSALPIGPPVLQMPVRKTPARSLRGVLAALARLLGPVRFWAGEAHHRQGARQRRPGRAAAVAVLKPSYGVGSVVRRMRSSAGAVTGELALR